MNNFSPQTAFAQRRMQIGADWFFWIAGLSLVNTLLLMGQNFIFLGFGLTSATIITKMAIARHVLPAAFGLNIVLSGFFAAFGYLGRKAHGWAFLVGLLFYALDGLVSLRFGDIIGILLHAYALWRIFQGFQACQEFKRLAASDSNYFPPPSDPGSWPPPPSGQ